MAQDGDDWINTPAFRWTPDVPLRPEPQALTSEPRADIIIPPAEPRFENPQLREPEIAAPSAPKPVASPRFVPAAAEKQKSPSLFLPRLAVGLAQGTALGVLLAQQDTLDPFIFSAAFLALLFAPLLLLAGLGRMKLAPLLLWTGFAAMLLAYAAAWHRWRTLSSDGGHPGLTLLVLVSLFLVIAQSIAHARAHDYPSFYRSAWALVIRVMLGIGFVGFAWVAAGAATGYMRVHYPQIPFPMLILPLIGVAVGLAAHLTGEKLLAALREGAVFVFTMALPFVLLCAAALAGLGACGLWSPAASVPLTLGFVLIVCINASYRDGIQWRPYWRRRAEFAASLLLLPLALLAASALAARIQQYGWTDHRIFAAAAILMLLAYALFYGGSALISLGGGGWMQRIEGSNMALGFAALTLIVALASPIADPARLAVAAQTARLEQKNIAPDAFDFLWLRDSGLRFGRESLDAMAAQTSAPAIARGAFAALTAPAQAARPTPTQIGANIHVGTAGKRLPAGLLSRDWSNVADAPPCLISASLPCEGFFTDLDGDGRDEIILAYGNDARWSAALMKQGQDSTGQMGGGWYVAGTLAAPPCPGSLSALRAGDFAPVPPGGNWRDLLVGGLRLKVVRPTLPSACPKA